MKKLVIAASLSFLIVSCNKNNTTTTTPTPATPDTTPPVLALRGGVNDTVSLNSVYADPGTTAVDNIDGNIGGNVVVSGNINKDLVGEYRLYYNVKDAAGNAAAQLTRYVYVANDADYLVGTYMANPNCGASATSSSTVILTTSITRNNQISFGILNNVSLITPSIIVSGSAITIPMQNGSSNNSISGNGTIAPSKTAFTLNYTAASGSAFPGTWNCTTQYVKQ